MRAVLVVSPRSCKRCILPRADWENNLSGTWMNNRGLGDLERKMCTQFTGPDRDTRYLSRHYMCCPRHGNITSRMYKNAPYRADLTELIYINHISRTPPPIILRVQTGTVEACSHVVWGRKRRLQGGLGKRGSGRRNSSRGIDIVRERETCYAHGE
ncbi:hypothetical protein AG1IA_07695 [Rhizoctonia solani AG-1 IA]|uniref:Uncharacterized protein n=1 Tax=Thanatephorus cucumeris (strain AG1-IA) TaxID=983506 RepID=L8WPM4_THACA|nr:hypothetical protein AG1IA_07695 [Rhizoctonia solani AG-1 IA]